MPFFDSHPSFTNEELAALRQTYIQACALLGLDGEFDTEQRERVARLVMRMANDGELNSDVIVRRVALAIANNDPGNI